jgi:dipeptidyl aminopeptidase/acylaminoacyl peptidase
VSAPPAGPLARLLDELDAWAREHGGPAGTVRYGSHESQELELRLPPGPGPHPVAVVLHGGFWRPAFTRGHTQALAVALTQAGWATANVEYRRLGPGAWRPMHDDVLAARRSLDGHGAPLDLARTVAVGHSAGGQLALWLAAQGAVSGAVALAAVSDLGAAARAGLGQDAVAELLGGGPDDVPEAYAATDPARRLPLGVPTLLVHGTEDDRVPLRLARAYAERARAAGDDCRLLELPGGGHFDPIDPRSPHRPALEAAVAELLP